MLFKVSFIFGFLTWVAVLLPNNALASGDGVLSWDLMFTMPVCEQPNKSDTWCKRSDRERASRESGLQARLEEIIGQAKDPLNAKIYIAYFKISDEPSFQALCKAGKKGVAIHAYFDERNRGMMEKLPERLGAECQGSAGNNVKIYFLGNKKMNPDGSCCEILRLHHNKLLLVDPGGDKPVYLNFSSGNLSASGLSIHFDHWVLLRLAKKSNMYEQHMCMLNALEQAVRKFPHEKIDSPERFINAFNECVNKSKHIVQDVESAINKEGVAPLFSPNTHNEVYINLKRLICSVKPGGRILGAIQHFTHWDLALDLQEAAARGVEVKLLLDDDIIDPNNEIVPEVEVLQQILFNSNIELKFMQTNGSEFAQFMHNKFLILEGVMVNNKLDTRVFSGAGQFTYNAMSLNYENFYLINNPVLLDKYYELFDYTWNRASHQ